MSTKREIPFNVFGWSLAVFLLFSLVQVVTVTAFTFAGGGISPFVAIFTWAAVSAAISFALMSRYRPTLPHLLLVQGVACFYMLAIAIAMALRSSSSLAPPPWASILGSIAALFTAGAMGIALARLIKDRSSR